MTLVGSWVFGVGDEIAVGANTIGSAFDGCSAVALDVDGSTAAPAMGCLTGTGVAPIFDTPHQVTPTTTAVANRPAATYGVLLRGTRSVMTSGCSCVGVAPDSLPSSCDIDSIDCGRSSGEIARVRITSDSRSRGTSGRSTDSGVGATVALRVSTSMMCAPSCGGRPLSISYKIAPTAYTSARASICNPAACSGAMYS